MESTDRAAGSEKKNKNLKHCATILLVPASSRKSSNATRRKLVQAANFLGKLAVAAGGPGRIRREAPGR
jgi:hypothetical protein